MLRWRFVVSGTIVGSVLLAACAAPSRLEGAEPPASSVAPATAIDLPPIAKAELPSRLTLSQTLAIAFERNPTFAEFEANREAARAEVIQALAYPNPEIEASIGRATPLEAPKETNATYGFSLVQPLESPTKRRTRRAAAEALEEIVDREEGVFRATLRAETAKAYFTILYRQRAGELAENARRNAEEIQAVVNRRVEAGEAPEIDRIKASVEMLKASRTVQSEQRRLASARAVLNALCGGALPEGFQLYDSLEDDRKAADASEAIQYAMDRHPLLLKLHAEQRKQEAVIARERAASRPDLKPGISAGREFDTNSVGLSLGVEIPIWNRNRGGVASAHAELNRIDAAMERTRLEIRRDIETALQNHESAREQIAAFGASLRASALESLKIETLLYEQGETDFLRLLDARRTAQETENEFLQALYDAAIARAELERATGKGDL